MPNGARFIAVIHFASRLNENPRGLNGGRAGLLVRGFNGCFFIHLILSIISAKTCSMFFPVESMTIASSATFNGESVRVESRLSRSVMSASVSVSVADEPAVI